MAEDPLKLTPEQLEKAVAWLQSHDHPAPPCPICGQNKWTVGIHLVQPITMGPDRNVHLGGVSYPFLQVISPKCGYTMFVNAVIAGLVPKAEDLPAEVKK